MKMKNVRAEMKAWLELLPQCDEWFAEHPVDLEWFGAHWLPVKLNWSIRL